MREFQLKDVEANLADLLDSVEHGETIAIVREGRRVARLVPEAESRRIEVQKALDSIKEIRKRTGKVSVEEILEWRDEGRR